MADLDKALLLSMYENLYKARRFDEELLTYFMQGKFSGMFHPSIGEEACGVGSILALKPGDFLGLHHRNHGHMLTRGCSMNKLLAEVLFKVDGFCMGKAGDVHVIDIEHDAYTLGGTLGPCFTIPLGPAFVFKNLGGKNIAVAYSGDSATNEGQFYEALNMAKMLKLPVLMIIQNNCYGVSLDIRVTTGGIHHLSTRAKAFEIPGVTVDGNDVEVVYQTVKEAADYVRAGNGPMLVELMTWRKGGHSPADPGKYKDPEEQAAWLARDPVDLFAKKMKDTYGFGDAQLDEIRNKVEAQIAEAKDYAENSPITPAEYAFLHLYADA
ncbi:MAG: thiamine pyrophosphate-dependent dehydrogenase E1 component subunit alpha [Christensenellales bacterium]